jgi:hypothetical protein
VRKAVKMLKYLGNGFLKKVPARDLTKEEVEALGVDPDALVESGLYEMTGDGGPKTGKEKTEDRGPETEEGPQDDQLEDDLAEYGLGSMMSDKEDVSEEDEIEPSQDE